MPIGHLPVLLRSAYKIYENLQRNGIEFRFPTGKSFLRSGPIEACILNLTEGYIQKLHYFAVFPADLSECLHFESYIACKLNLFGRSSRSSGSNRGRSRGHSRGCS